MSGQRELRAVGVEGIDGGDVADEANEGPDGGALGDAAEAVDGAVVGVTGGDYDNLAGAEGLAGDVGNGLIVCLHRRDTGVDLTDDQRGALLKPELIQGNERVVHDTTRSIRGDTVQPDLVTESRCTC